MLVEMVKNCKPGGWGDRGERLGVAKNGHMILGHGTNGARGWRKKGREGKHEGTLERGRVKGRDPREGAERHPVAEPTATSVVMASRSSLVPPSHLGQRQDQRAWPWRSPSCFSTPRAEKTPAAVVLVSRSCLGTPASLSRQPRQSRQVPERPRR